MKRRDKRNRREFSNAQLMEQALSSAKRIRLQIVVRLKHPQTGLYVAYTGSASTVDSLSVKQADHFVKSVRALIVHVAKRGGLTVPRK